MRQEIHQGRTMNSKFYDNPDEPFYAVSSDNSVARVWHEPLLYYKDGWVIKWFDGNMLHQSTQFIR